MALESLSTTELAHRLSRTKHGVGDPVKSNQLSLACSRRLLELQSRIINFEAMLGAERKPDPVVVPVSSDDPFPAPNVRPPPVRRRDRSIDLSQNPSKLKRTTKKKTVPPSVDPII